MQNKNKKTILLNKEVGSSCSKSDDDDDDDDVHEYTCTEYQYRLNANMSLLKNRKLVRA